MAEVEVIDVVDLSFIQQLKTGLRVDSRPAYVLSQLIDNLAVVNY